MSPLSGACRLRGPMSHGFRRGLHYAAPSRGWVKHGGRPQVFEPLRLPQSMGTNACAAPAAWKAALRKRQKADPSGDSFEAAKANGFRLRRPRDDSKSEWASAGRSACATSGRQNRSHPIFLGRVTSF